MPGAKASRGGRRKVTAPRVRPARVYLAGPMSGYPRWNYDAFEAATAKLRSLGLDVTSPHEIDLGLGFDPDTDPETFTQADWHKAMRRDIAEVLKVDGVVVLPGWEDSAGAQVEVTVARALGIPVEEFRP